MQIEELIGMNVKEAREEAGLTQRELGEQIAWVHGKPWLPQAVSQAEKGGRDWAVRDLIAVAWALRRPVVWFFKVPTGISQHDVLELPPEAPAPQLTWVAGEAASEPTADELSMEILRLTQQLTRVIEAPTIEAKATVLPPTIEVSDEDEP